MKVTGGKKIKSVKSAWSILHSELTSYIVHPPLGNNKGQRTYTQLIYVHSLKGIMHKVIYLLAPVT